MDDQSKPSEKNAKADPHEHGHSPGHHDGCVYCGYDLPFDLPEAVVHAAKHGRLVVFAGAGISTESSTVFPTSLYDELKYLAKVEVEDPSFPFVMSQFEAAFGRRELITEIVKRLDYVESFPAIQRLATKFHRELSTIGCINTIITTNWDTAFEDYCHARPFVVDEDYAYYDLEGRKVFKIHGSVSNVSSLIATEEDYASREADFAHSAMGSSLKHFLATETVVFVGFSLKDSDFQSIYRALLSGLGRSRPPAYFISPFESVEAAAFDLKVLQTDGSNFLRSLKARLVEDDVLLPDSVIPRADMLRYATSTAQNEMLQGNWREHPALFFSLAYQDGLMDLCGRVAQLSNAGEYTYAPHLAHIARTYDKLLDRAIERRRFWDASYIDGYLTGLFSLFMQDKDHSEIDLYETFEGDSFPNGDVHIEGDPEIGADERSGGEGNPADLTYMPPLHTEAEIRERYDSGSFELRDEALAEMQKYLASVGPGLIPKHTPFLDGVIDEDD